jgi:phosphoglycolate phosphatase
MVLIIIPGSSFKKIELVIFDKDGTLMELYQYWSQMSALRADLISKRLNLTAEQREKLLFAMGVDADSKKLREKGPVGLKKREIVMQAAVDYLSSIGQGNTGDLCFTVFEEVDRCSESLIDQLVQPIPGSSEIISALHGLQCKIAIATTDRSYRAVLAMKKLDFADKIDLIVGTDMVKRAKPDPEMVRYILEKLDVRREHALVIGDAETDIQMGSSAGVKASIGVLTGLTPRNELQRYTPYIIDSVAQLRVFHET